jgi:cytochrome c peroxidase
MYSIVIAVILYAFLAAGPAFAGKLEPVTSVPVPAANPQTPEKIELGKQLFFDRRLSGDGTMSCSTCHDPEKGYSDDLAISLSYPTTRNWRNSPTLINVGFQKYLFHDGRAHTLEEQALFPMMSAFEMNRNLDFVEEVIRSVPEYVEAFRRVFGGEVSRERMAMALASFQRTLVSVNSPLDRFLNGDGKAFSPEVKKGYDIFIGKGKCADCHDGVNLADNKFYALNVPENAEQEKDPRVAATRRFVAKVSHYDDYLNLKEDPGRYLVTKDKKDWKAFRTPTLREIAKTGPYMHNGIFENLDQVIEFFDQGGGRGNNALKPLKLSAEEKKSLKVFMEEALTGVSEPFKYPKVP